LPAGQLRNITRERAEPEPTGKTDIMQQP